MIEIPEDLIDQFILRRKELKMTQEEVSKKAGISRPMLASLESNRRNPTLSTLNRWATALRSHLDLVAEE
jgi:transcriptional regulator with XRE-family HTH domain